MDRIVVSGATGAIGIALVNYALSRQMTVLAVCHRGSSRIAWLPSAEKLHILELDAEEYAAFTQDKDKLGEIGKFDCFFHLAWQGTTGDFRNDVGLQLRNAKYTLDAVELAAALGCQCFLGSGSQAEYGRVDGKISSATPTFPENGYGIGKLCAGQMSRLRCEQLGMKHIWTRILSVYGPGESGNSPIMSAIIGFLHQSRTEFTAGMQKWDYLYSGDAARALMGLAEYGENGKIYCVGSGEVWLLKEYIHKIYAMINEKDASDEQLGIGMKPYADKQVMHLQADISEWPEGLKAEFEKEPMYSFEEGISHLIDWYKVKYK